LVELGFEALRGTFCAWHHEVGDVCPKDESEELDAPPQVCVETAHAANPWMLQCVVPGPRKT
jgi:hypothetical protein